MRTSSHHSPPRSIGLVAAALVAASFASSLMPAGPDHQAPQWVHLVTLALFTLLAFRRAWIERRVSWYLITVFAVCTTAAQALWMRAGVLGGPDGSGGAADAIYLAGVTLGVLGLGVIVFGPLRGARRWRTVSDGVVVGSATVFTLWTFVYQPQLAGLPADARAAQQTRLAYVALDLMIAALLVTAALYQRNRPIVAWVAGGVTMAAVADGILTWSLGRGGQGANPLSIAAWTMAAIMFVITVVAPDGPVAAEPAGAPRRDLVYGAMVVAITALGGQIVLNGSLDRTTLLILFAMAVTVLLNQFWVNQEIGQLTRTNIGALARAESSERRFRSIFEHAPVAMAIGAMDGEILDANPALGRMLGVPTENLLGRTTREFASAADWHDREQRLGGVLAGEADRFSRRITLPLPDGRTVRLELTVSTYRTADGDDRLIAVIEDVTERLASRERLEYLADHDPLTGLPNRYRFSRELAARLERADRPVAVAFIDLDRFKVINDGMGHEAGDQVLLEAATRLEHAVGADGLVARFGGDEFTVLVEGGDGPVQAVVDRIIRSMAAPVDLGGGDRFHPTVSIGVSTARAGNSPERVVSEADAAMYRAKERGRNRAEFFTPSGPRDAAVTLRLTDDLHRAIEHDELELHYQPLIDVASGWTTGYEALLRWRHPDRGLIGPDRFLDLAEETGLIVEIGEWVLRTACTRAAGWPDGPGGFAPSVSVNVAARQLVEPGLVEVAADALTISGLSADHLWLEVTETALMADVRAAADTLRALRGLGLHLALDDFGTGYSSLTYLKRFPFESIKIDRTFVEGLGVDPDDTAIVEAVVGLARSLGLASVAEGVETPLQLRALGDIGCDVVQGYLLGRPQPVPTVEVEAATVPTAPPAPTTPH